MKTTKCLFLNNKKKKHFFASKVPLAASLQIPLRVHAANTSTASFRNFTKDSFGKHSIDFLGMPPEWRSGIFADISSEISLRTSSEILPKRRARLEATYTLKGEGGVGSKWVEVTDGQKSQRRS